jgi:cytochrome P450/NADPH-cytochrome P450 reductase
VQIHRDCTGADAGERWIADLGAQNRYVLDVWAGG